MKRAAFPNPRVDSFVQVAPLDVQTLPWPGGSLPPKHSTPTPPKHTDTGLSLVGLPQKGGLGGGVFGPTIAGHTTFWSEIGRS